MLKISGGFSCLEYKMLFFINNGDILFFAVGSKDVTNPCIFSYSAQIST
jgi:hypothetical protein